MPPAEADASSFEKLRPRLVRVAYRMLGSVAEAEDIVQDAYLRWSRTDRAEIRDMAAFLHRIVARLSLDHLRSARSRRETYIGPWLPEPVIDPSESGEVEDLTLHLMMALERLSPLERAAFLLHDVFDMPFEEVARAIDRDPAACRQLASRARSHVRSARPRFPVAEGQGRAIAAAFQAAAQDGDLGSLQELLAADVVLYTDGGGKRRAAINPILGRDNVARFFAGIARKPAAERAVLVRESWIDGLPGYVSADEAGGVQTTALAIEGGRIAVIYIVRNPDKLRHLRQFVGPTPS